MSADPALPPTPLLDVMKQAVIATDLAGKIAAWNCFAEDLYGWRREEVIGQHVLTLIPAPSFAKRAELTFDVVRRGRSWGGQFTARDRDGREFEVLTIVAPFIDASMITGVVGISMRVPRVGQWPHGSDGRDTLTAREMEIATLTAEGKTSGEIAALLHVAVRTVESHRFNIYGKLGVRSRAELTMLALRHGILR